MFLGLKTEGVMNYNSIAASQTISGVLILPVLGCMLFSVIDPGEASLQVPLKRFANEYVAILSLLEF